MVRKILHTLCIFTRFKILSLRKVSDQFVFIKCDVTVLDVCMLWTVVMTLLDDDCTHVRELIASLATELECTKLPVMSQRARKLLMEYFVDMMLNLDALMCAVCLVAWCLGTTNSDCDDGLSEVRTTFTAKNNSYNLASNY